MHVELSSEQELLLCSTSTAAAAEGPLSSHDEQLQHVQARTDDTRRGVDIDCAPVAQGTVCGSQQGHWWQCYIPLVGAQGICANGTPEQIWYFTIFCLM